MSGELGRATNSKTLINRFKKARAAESILFDDLIREVQKVKAESEERRIAVKNARHRMKIAEEELKVQKGINAQLIREARAAKKDADEKRPTLGAFSLRANPDPYTEVEPQVGNNVA